MNLINPSEQCDKLRILSTADKVRRRISFTCRSWQRPPSQGVLRRGRKGEARHRTRGSDEGEWTDDGGDPVKTVTVRDLQKKVKACVDGAQADRVIITRHGKPAAVLVRGRGGRMGGCASADGSDLLEVGPGAPEAADDLPGPIEAASRSQDNVIGPRVCRVRPSGALHPQNAGISR